jgi:hypothetical protein
MTYIFTDFRKKWNDSDVGAHPVSEGLVLPPSLG